LASASRDADARAAMQGGSFSTHPRARLTRTLRRGAARWLGRAANAAFSFVLAWDKRFPTAPFQPQWAPAPLKRKADRSFPELGWPRTTDSLCPGCVKDVRGEILNGSRDLGELIQGRPGEVRAQIIERDGKVLMVKDCAKHGHFEDVMSIDPAFLRRIERLFPG